MEQIEGIIEKAFERRADLSPENADAEVRAAVERAIELMDTGRARVAEKRDGRWVVNEWLKKAVLLSFRITESKMMDGGFARYYDKVPTKFVGQSDFEHRARQL